MKRKNLFVILMFVLAIATVLTLRTQRSEAQSLGPCSSVAFPYGTNPEFKRYEINGNGKSMKLVVYAGDSANLTSPYWGQIPVTDAAFDSIQATVLMVAKSPSAFDFTIGTSGSPDYKICYVSAKPRGITDSIPTPITITPTPTPRIVTPTPTPRY